MPLRTYLIELVGTFLLVFFSAAIVCVSRLADPATAGVGLVGIAVAQGSVLAVVLLFSTRVSDGCLNPAVTLALWVTRRTELSRAWGLITVQLIGAVFAGGLVVAVFDPATLERAYAGTPHLRVFTESAGSAAGPEVTTGDWLVGSLVEAVLTFLLTMALLTAVLDPARPRWGVMIAGLALTAGVLVGYHLTGAAMNPARWLGPAVWQRTVPTLSSLPLFRDHLPYWMGPVVGAMLAAVVHAEWLRPAGPKT